ncbi:DUF7144 family membrane protein [Aeromicrobium sp.]|uniref:DUF7144 family membrane protein n=1 Tax=Aeromicrobium sp. TaxID=1871063 RepID=UPI003D6B7BFD
MSEANVAAGRRSDRNPSSGSGWYGLIVFAGAMMILLGSFHAMAGLVALFKDDYFLVGQNGLVVTADFTTWGWVHLIVGSVIALAGFALFAGATWARVIAVIVAVFSALVNLAFLAAYPVWGAIMIALSVLVIYAVTAHGGEVATDDF